MDIKTAVQNMQWVEAPPNDTAEDAITELGRIVQGQIRSFKLLGQVGRVVLAEFEPVFKGDPIVPIVINPTSAARSAVRKFVEVMYQNAERGHYERATKAAARYLASCQFLNPNEYEYLKRQLQLCAVDPTRQAVKR